MMKKRKNIGLGIILLGLAVAGSSACSAESPNRLMPEGRNLSASSHRGNEATGGKPPVKVYILSGQSNMVGIGEVGPSGATRFNTYLSKDTKAEQGVTLSIYRGAYDPEVDYERQEPVETHQVRLGYWPHKAFPRIDEPSTSIARGFIRIGRSGVYSFKPSKETLLEIGGEVMFHHQGGETKVDRRVEFDEGTYPLKLTFLDGKGYSLLAHQIWDLPGTLYTLVKTDGKFPYLMDADGEWVSRDDVWYKGVVTATANKWLSVGCGAGRGGKIGPELGFGWVLGDYHEEPVLVLKASQGNRSLAWDYLPPGSERYEATVKDKQGQSKRFVYAGYQDSPARWEKETEPEKINWYAGKQYDDCFGEARRVLENFDAEFPHWAGRGYEIAGFGWWQGHKDQNEVHAERYEQNLIQLIKALRKDFQAPDAPFVIATIGFCGWDLDGHGLTIADAQLAVSGEKGRYPEFKGNVKTVETRDFWRDQEISPKNQGFHYNQNAETYMLVGQVMGQGMVELLEGKGGE